ncbi:MAG: AAA family ATPase, partial [Muribaculaceae bacterium]|nr:AAA family ATPase [Muribaculaceae bacterium]
SIENIDLDNIEFQNAWKMIQNTHRSVFLTGKAGTGKSTFLKYICAHTKKEHVVLAPTGIAAVNVGGQTLHSFFKIPFKPLLPDDPDFSPRRIRKTLRYSAQKVKLIRKLDLIIIDEISMVRCDIIDFIDKVLKVYSGNMREPFGGKQLLFVGDIFQLEPVVTRDMKEILRRYYQQFFFFNARVFNSLGLIPIELRKIYRQNDSAFVAMLDRIRVSHATATDLNLLNSRCNTDYQEQEDSFMMTLATRRDTVDSINSEHMQALDTPEYTFMGVVEGTFPDNDLPTNKELTLKKGAQVIFLRNDKDGRWVNGTIGKVSRLDESGVEVALETGDCYVLEEEVWENVQYTYDEKEKKVLENVVGTFRQYPIKPAWALTVHKSQGLTFNNIVIDFAGGAFSSGQTYVALSRCTSLEGITLLKPLSQRDIIVNTAIVDFSRQFNNQAAINDAVMLEKANGLYTMASIAFDHDDYSRAIDCFAQAMEIRNLINDPLSKRFIKHKFHKFDKLKEKIRNLEDVIDSQNKMLLDLAAEFTAMGDQSMGMGVLAQEEEVTYGSSSTRLDEIAIKSALANYNKALRLSPGYVPAMLGKARLMYTIGEIDDAIAQIKNVLAIDKNCYDALMAMAQIHENEKDTPAAIKAYKRAVKASRKASAPHVALARIYEKIGLDDLAQDHHDIARRLQEQQQKKSTRQRKK